MNINDFDIDHEPWMQDGACLTTDPDAFFPPPGGDVRAPKSICGGCDVIDSCFEFAMRTSAQYGVFGGKDCAGTVGHSDGACDMTRLTHNTAQILPPIHDERATVTAWVAWSCLSADHRKKYPGWAEVAGELIVERDD